MWSVNRNAFLDHAFITDIPSDSGETQDTRNLQPSEPTNVRTETAAQSNSSPVHMNSTSKSTISLFSEIFDNCSFLAFPIRSLLANQT